jgi:hypothetical protein
MLPIEAGMIGTTTHSFFPLGWKLFCPDWPETMILPITASQIARVIVMATGARLQPYSFECTCSLALASKFPLFL